MSDIETNSTKDSARTITPKEAFAAVLMELIESHNQALFENSQAAGQCIDKFGQQVMSFFQKLENVNFEPFLKKLEEQRKNLNKTMQLTSEQGWFFNWVSPSEQTAQLWESLRIAQNPDEIDRVMLEHHELHWDYYLARLSEIYPMRKNVIGAAVNAHKNYGPEGYSLSIPVFLAQADGILSEITGITMAMARENKSELKKGSKWVQDQIGEDPWANDFLVAILRLHTLDILKSEDARKADSTKSGKNFNALNRHQVMHGEVSDYGNVLNSTKAFSFLIYVALHIPDVLKTAGIARRK